MDIETLKRDFRAVYREEPQVFRAPGRVNLIGEHTDYNEGFVMPAAIDFYTAAAIAPRSDTKVNVRSQSFDRAVSFDIARRSHGSGPNTIGPTTWLESSTRSDAQASVLAAWTFSFRATCQLARA